jgi:AbrB family looped-hinge helix DNA binding protein
MDAVVSEKGQVTIPKPLRDRLGIRAGEVLRFDEERGRLIAVKAVTRDPVDEVYGVLQFNRSTDELIGEMRGEVDAV